MKKILLLLLLLIIFLPPKVRADVVVPGYRNVEHCFTIDNLEEFPDYVFIMNDALVSGYKVMDLGSCESFYKLGVIKVYAISRPAYDQSELSEEFFRDSPKLVGSDDVLSMYGAVQENDPLQKVITKIHIESVVDKVEYSRSMQFIYKDGRSEVKPVVDGETPKPSRQAIPYVVWNIVYFIVLPLGALAGIVYILVKKKR